MDDHAEQRSRRGLISRFSDWYHGPRNSPRVTLGLVLGSVLTTTGYMLYAESERLFPYSIYDEVYAFVTGKGEIRPTTLWQKIVTDVGVEPLRFARGRVEVEMVSPLAPLESDVVFSGSRELPMGWRAAQDAGATPADDLIIVYGVFELQQGRYGAVLIDPSAGQSGRIVRRWVFDRHFETMHPEKLTFDAETGLFIVNTMRKVRLFDYCGEEKWAKAAPRVHHSTEFTPDGQYLWHWDGLDMVKRRVVNGAEVHRFSLLDVIVANPDDTTLHLRLKATGWQIEDAPEWSILSYHIPVGKDGKAVALDDTFHPNDIEPVPPGFFPDHDGELIAVSVRSLNMIMILDVETGDIVHRLIGRTSRQHDVDFHQDGTVTIFDNQNHLGAIRIVEWLVDKGDVRTLYDGAAMAHVNAAHGKMERFGDNGFLIVDYLGRVYTVEDGEPRYLFENTYDDETALELRSASLLPRANYESFERNCNMAVAEGNAEDN